MLSHGVGSSVDAVLGGLGRGMQRDVHPVEGTSAAAVPNMYVLPTAAAPGRVSLSEQRERGGDGRWLVVLQVWAGVAPTVG